MKQICLDLAPYWPTSLLAASVFTEVDLSAITFLWPERHPLIIGFSSEVLGLINSVFIWEKNNSVFHPHPPDSYLNIEF